MPMTRRNASVVAVLFASAALAACTTEQQSTPAPPLTSTTSTTAVSSEITAPPAPPEPSAEVTEPPTVASTIAVPSGPTSALVPLLAGGASDGGWLFVGVWQSGNWEPSSTPDGQQIRPGIEAGASFSLTNLDGMIDAVAGNNVEACVDGRFGPSFDVAVEAPDPPGFGYSTLAVLAPTWPLKPRPVAIAATAPASYQALGEAAFIGSTVDATPGSFRQLVIADLDGDGDDEVLGAFEYVQPSTGPGAPGDLAAIVLIDPAAKTVSTVTSSFVVPDLGPDEIPQIERFRVLDVADLNGDGLMEIIVHGWYHEGASVTVYTYDGLEITEVLTAGCDS